MSRFSGMGKESQVARAKKNAKDRYVDETFFLFMKDVYPDKSIFTITEMQHAYKKGWYDSSFDKEGE